MINYIRINKIDNVAVALTDLKKGTSINIDSVSFSLLEDIKKGHKFAINDIKSNENIIKYGLPIGRAYKEIKIGEHVHTNNVLTNLKENEEYIYNPINIDLPKLYSKKFMGFRREDGKVGVRNEIWILPIVGCVNSLSKKIVSTCEEYINGSVEGIYTFTHPYGCSQLGDDHKNTRKLLVSLAKHPNAGGVLVVGLGCENLTIKQFKTELGEYDDKRIKFIIAQEVEDEVLEAKKLVKELIDNAKKYRREEIDASELIVGMKCGGSDGLSGITANPLVGTFSDKLISIGGTTILTEVPEMFGAEKILFNKCINKNIFDKAINMINRFKKYFIKYGQTIYENPSPGNIEGGITTLEDKSCGCVEKGGNANIVDCLDYGEIVSKKGLNLLYGPGNDLVSSTALAASGSHIILFTTGRGTPFGAPVPTIKISSNTELYNKKKNWIDFDAGKLLDSKDINELSDEFIDYVLKVASGEKTNQEKNNYKEIAIFKDGVTL